MDHPNIVAITATTFVNANLVVDITETAGDAVIKLSNPWGVTELTVTGVSALEAFRRIQMAPKVELEPRHEVS